MRLEAKDVNISISGKPIVQHLSIEVPDRKFSAFLGANGSLFTSLILLAVAIALELIALSVIRAKFAARKR